MKKAAIKLIVCVLLMLSKNLNAQTNAELNIGVMPVFTAGSENVLFIDCDRGELKSFAALEEPIWGININEDENIFFAQSRHHIYKGSLESGEILEKYQYMEVIEHQKEDAIDPNSNIIPYGVTKDGMAFYGYNSELLKLSEQQQEVLKKMGDASMDEINALSKKSEELTQKMLPLYKTSELYLVDFTSKSKKLYGKFHMDEEQFIGLDKGLVKFYDKQNDAIKFKDIVSKEVVKERSTAALFDQYPDFKNKNYGTPTEVSENLLCYSFFGQTGGGVYILFNTDTNESLYYKEFTSAMSSSYPLRYTNTTNYLFADKSCDIGPMPAIPDFGTPSGTSKKKIAAWQEEMTRKQNEHQKALKKWQDKATNPENCSITIFEDDELEKVKMEIPNASFAFIYNDIYALVNRNFEIVLYNLETKEEEWIVDTDF